jgi:hypothetical protein
MTPLDKIEEQQNWQLLLKRLDEISQALFGIWREIGDVREKITGEKKPLTERIVR